MGYLQRVINYLLKYEFIKYISYHLNEVNIMTDRLIFTALLITTACVFIGCMQQAGFENKLSPELMHQMELKGQFLLSRDIVLFEQIQEEGLSTDNISIQKVILYFNEELDAQNDTRLKEQGVKIIIDSWIPAMAGNEYGSLIAEIPIDKIEETMKNDFIIRIDTAEGQGLRGCNIIPR
jgi:hypothetical protein